MPAIWSRYRATAMPLGIRIADVIQSADKTLHAVPHLEVMSIQSS